MSVLIPLSIKSYLSGRSSAAGCSTILLFSASENSDNLDYDLVKIDLPKLAEGECLIEVHASSVNPSDVKAILGVMPALKWPRTPGRNYSGIVIDGDTELIGKEVIPRFQ